MACRWLSLRPALQAPPALLSLGITKLCNGATFDPSDVGHVLAVLGQRFALTVSFGHRDSVTHLENGVADHLRICLGTTPDRNWRYTSYPSEPFVSWVATMELHADPRSLERALNVLVGLINRGMINIGEHGELASRLIWLLAKDLFLRREEQPKNQNSWDEDIPYCTMIPVVDWLAFVFGAGIWTQNTAMKSAQEAFRNAYLNFSHWISMQTNIVGSKTIASVCRFQFHEPTLILIVDSVGWTSGRYGTGRGQVQCSAATNNLASTK